MLRKALAGFAAACALGAPHAAFAVSAPPASGAWVDGAFYAAPVQTADGKLFQIGDDAGAWTVDVAGEFGFSVSAAMNADPFIAYAVAVYDYGAPSSFAFGFADPLLPPVTGPNAVRANLAGSLIDLSGNGISLAPAVGGFVQLARVGGVVVAPVSLGIDVGPAFSSGAALPGSAYIYSPYQAGYPVALSGPVGPWDYFAVGVAFSLSGGGDIATLNGYAEIIPVPEPSAWLTMTLGLGLVGLGARRRATTRTEA